MKTIPQEALKSHIAILGKTGSGKTTAAKGMIEGLLDASERVCIIDPTGAWHGLRSSANGKSAGYAVVIFGGEHGDWPLVANAAEGIADVVGTSNTPCVIDTSQLRTRERTQFFADFADAIMRKNKGPLHLVVDESHLFMPQGKVPDPQAGVMLAAGNNMVSGGRSRGLRITLITQRPAKLHKDALTQVETLIAMRLIAPQDRKAVEEWIKDNADLDKGREIMTSLATLKTGNGWIWSPELNVLERIAFPRCRTFDSSAAPNGDDSKIKLATIDRDAIAARLQTSAEQVVANDPVKLRQRIAELQRELNKPKDMAVDASVLEAAEKRGFERSNKFSADAQAAVISVLRSEFEELENRFSAAFLTTLNSLAPPSPIAYAVHPQNVKRSLATEKAIGQMVKHAHETIRTQNPVTRNTGSDLPKGETAVLSACIQFPNGLRREQLTVLTAYKRSSRDAYIQRLREKGYVDMSGDLVTATDDGIAALPDVQPLPTGEALQEYWLQRLPEGERKILTALIEDYPNTVERQQLDKSTGYQRSSRDAYLQRLGAKQLVEFVGRGEVKASQELF